MKALLKVILSFFIRDCTAPLDRSVYSGGCLCSEGFFARLARLGPTFSAWVPIGHLLPPGFFTLPFFSLILTGPSSLLKRNAVNSRSQFQMQTEKVRKLLTENPKPLWMHFITGKKFPGESLCCSLLKNCLQPGLRSR